jgi:hypothetical protein
MGSSGLGRVGPEPSAIRPKTGEVLYAPTAGFSVFRTGSRRHFEPVIWRRPILKTYFEAVKARFHRLNFLGSGFIKSSQAQGGKIQPKAAALADSARDENKRIPSGPWGASACFLTLCLPWGNARSISVRAPIDKITHGTQVT